MLVNLFVFILGAVAGSFLNVCIYRLPRGKSIVWPGSYCPECKTNVRFYDNIPIISFLLLRGRCRKCKKLISFRYPLVELLTGLLFLINFGSFGFRALDLFSISGLGFYLNAIFISFLIISFFSDLETQTIPDQPVYIIIALGLAYNFFKGTSASSLWGLFWGFALLYVVAFMGKLYYKKEVLGGGDIKLSSAFGAYLGIECLFLSLALGYFIGAMGGIILIALGKKKLKDYIPFAPALTAGALTALFFGRQIMVFYVAYFLGT